MAEQWKIIIVEWSHFLGGLQSAHKPAWNFRQITTIIKALHVALYHNESYFQVSIIITY